MSDRFLIPVGFYCGHFLTDQDDVPEYWQVRVGQDVYDLPTYDDFRVWVQARGVVVGDAVDQSRHAVLTAAKGIGVRHVEAILESLILSGLIVEVGAHPWQLEDFAAAFTLQSLMVGVGNTREAPDEFLLGHDQTHVYAKLTREQYDVWSLGYLARNLQDAARENARSFRPDVVRPEIERLCRISGELLVRNAAYVDRA